MSTPPTTRITTAATTGATVDAFPTPDGPGLDPQHPGQTPPEERTSGQVPGPGPGPVGWGAVEWARWAWRQLTSMRTALMLLFLLAAGAVPGSLFPQRGVDPGAVTGFLTAHRRLGPLLDRLSMFDVYASAWFAAIYLLLMVSLVGCVLPRTAHHARVLRRPPPAVPSRLDRLPLHQTWPTDAEPDVILARAARLLRGRGYRVAVEPRAVRAEKGLLRETGNLAFHLALLGVLAGIAATALFGVRGQALIVQGGSFTDQPTDYDMLTPGRLADTGSLPPFTIALDDFTATYQTSGPQTGTPTSFRAVLDVRDTPGAPARRAVVEVNHPLSVEGTKVYLTGHGYAPVIAVRDATGATVYDAATVFLPQDGVFTSTGVVKIPDARPGQLGLTGFLLPTAAAVPGRGPVSVFPALLRPELFLTGYTGDLGLDAGAARSVYTLDTSAMTQLRADGKPWAVALRPGQTAALPDGRGSITFTGVREYAVFKIARDPGKLLILTAVLLMLLGIVAAVGIRQRRVWVRVQHPNTDDDIDAGGGTRVELGALPRNHTAGTATEFTTLVAELKAGNGDNDVNDGGAGSGS